MFVILAYDITVPRGQKIMKICRKYLRHIQKSVFEGEISEARLKRLQKELKNIIVEDKDRICIYCLDSIKYTYKIQIGLYEEWDVCI